MGKTAIKKNGISKCHKKKMRYFSQISSREIITIPDYMPDIEKIVSVIIDPKIISVRAISTMVGESEEGQYLSGCKLVVEIELKQKILYAADTKSQSIHVVENTILQSAYIIVPKDIEGTEMKKLLKEHRFNVKIYIEDIVIKRMDARKIFKNIFLLLEGIYRPTFEICYSEKHCGKTSHIFICYDNGKHLRKITHNEKVKNITPKWSPTGQEIAYLAYEDGSFIIYIYNANSHKFTKITRPEKYDCITSFCWSNKGDKIYFTGNVKNTKEIFCINTKSLKCKQLTYGDDNVKSYKPKCSYDGQKIAYIKSFANSKNLYVMDSNGLKSQKITDCGFIQDFDWGKDNNIVYIQNNHLGKLCICVVNICTLEKVYIKIPSSVVSLKKVKYSSKGNYITYIANDFSTQDIYLYDINKNKTLNLTKNISNITISDYVWKVNEKKIFYSADNLGYYNIYSLDLEKNRIFQITNSTASYIELSYRPRIL